MAELTLYKGADGALHPLDQQSKDYITPFKIGQGFQCEVKRHNNPAFHRKMMALFNLGFKSWNPENKEYKGEIVAKEFNQFRKDITILAGFYDASINFNGEVRLTAKSLNFSAMKQEEREKLYSAVIDVLLERVLTRYDREDVETVVNQVLGFA
jgi:hypothetical protein